MRMTIKIATDIIMAALFLLLMADRHTGNAVHEWLGVILAGAFLLHIWLNRSWYTTLTQGRYNFFRIIQIVLNMFLLLAVMGTLTSAVLISRTVFLFSEPRGELFSRTVHVCCAHWCFLLAAAHLGMYGKRLGTALGRHVHFSHPRWWERVSPVLYVAFSVYGAYVFLSRELVYPLTMNSAFMPWSENEHIVFFFFDYGTIFFLCAWATCIFSRLLRKGKGQYGV